MMVQSLLFMKVRTAKFNEIEAWLSKKGLKNKRTLIVVIAFVLYLFIFIAE